MVIKVYLSGISASKEVKKRQQRALFILDSLKVNYETVDITEPGHEDDRQMIKDLCKKRDASVPLPPQFFKDDQYCGDWFDFEAASDDDKVLVLLKLEDEKQNVDTVEGETKSKTDVQLNGEKEDAIETNESKREINDSESKNKSDDKVSVENDTSDKKTESTVNENSDPKDVPNSDENKTNEDIDAHKTDEDVAIPNDTETKNVDLSESSDEKKDEVIASETQSKDVEEESKREDDSENVPLKNNDENKTSDDTNAHKTEECISIPDKDAGVELSASSDEKKGEAAAVETQSEDVKEEVEVGLKAEKEENIESVADDPAYEEVEANREVTVYEVHDTKTLEPKKDTDKNEKDVEVELKKKEDSEASDEE